MKLANSPKKPANESSKKNLQFLVNETAELLEILRKLCPTASRTEIKSWLQHRQIAINDKVTTQFNHALNAGDKITILRGRQPEPFKHPKLRLVFEDEFILVVDKKNGLLTIATDREKEETAYRILSDHVKEQDPSNKLFIVHRIDRDTSGLLLFAKSKTIQQKLQENWSSTVIDRTYIAVVEGSVEKDSGTVESWLRESTAFKVHSSQNPGQGQHSITHYNVIERAYHFTLLKLQLETGRKNQIRVHMQDMGHSIVGDKKYGSKQSPIGRMCLHAQTLQFIHPVSGEKLEFSTPIPKAFHQLVQE